MPPAAWRLMLLPLIVGAFLMVGAPNLPAFERAVRKAFDSLVAPSAGATTTTVPAASTDETSPKAGVAPANGNNRGVLVPLYVSFAALQALDAHSTMRALSAGGTEANPVMSGLAGTPAALLAVKAGVAISTIYLIDKVRVKSRRTAIVLSAALNSAYAVIVAHNYRAARR